MSLLGSLPGTQYGQILVTGTADLGGAQLLVGLLFDPVIPVSFQILKAATLVNKFAPPDLPNPGPNFKWAPVDYTNKTVTLTIEAKG